METRAAAGSATSPCAEVRPPLQWHKIERLKHKRLSDQPVLELHARLLHLHLLCMAVNCGRPDVDYNGAVYGNDWWVGSVVRYTCRSGFMLVGNPTRSCQPNGLWTPKPTCLREWPQWHKDFITPYEAFQLHVWLLSACLSGMCQRGSIEISERELNGTCNSTCAYKSYFGPPKQGCTRIDNCKKKETGWKRFFAQCVPCICDCALSCGE